MATDLPAGSENIVSEDTDTLRYAARVRGDSAFLFFDNYQDHAETRDLNDIRITLRTPSQEIKLPKRRGFTLKKNECAVFPVNLDIDGITLRHSTAQLLTKLIIFQSLGNRPGVQF